MKTSDWLPETRSNLTWLWRHYDTIQRHLAPNGERRSGGSRSKPTSQPPLNTAALSLVQRGGLAGHLNEWVKLIVEGRHINPPNYLLSDRDFFDKVITTLRANIDWCADQEWFGDMHHEVSGLRRSVEVICGLVNEEPIPGDNKNCVRDRVVGVDENGEDTTVPCGGKLWQDHDREVIYCRRCKTPWPKTQWLHLGRMLRDAAIA